MIIATIKDYINMVTSAYKVAFLSMLLLSAAGYVGYINIKLIRAERNVVYYKGMIENYKISVTQMKERIDYERSNTQKTKQYYESLDCINRKKGELTDEDITGRAQPKTLKPSDKPIQGSKKIPFWKSLF
jgi:hypothetical protein